MSEFNIYEQLMPKVQALISPRDINNKEKSIADLHSLSKKRGKRNNHDYCDACGEKGSVLCCDICPASFHLLCHDPPLLRADKSSYWLCSSCKHMMANEKRNAASIKRRELSRVSEESSKANKVHAINSKKDDEIVYLPSNTSVANLQKNNKIDTNGEVNKFITDTPSEQESNLTEDVEIKDELMDVEDDENELQLKEENDALSDGLCSANSGNREDSDDVSIKNELQLFEHTDSFQETEDDVSNTNHVGKGFGADKTTKANENKENVTYSSKWMVAQSRKRPRKNEADEYDVVKKMKHKNFNINLPNCDFLLPVNESENDSGENLDVRPNPRKKKGRPKKHAISTEIVPKNLDGIPRIFYDIIRDAKKMNPRQFTLPVEYILDIDMNLTGCEKDPEAFPNDFDSNDLIKIPPRRCYYCKGICLTGEMVSCDFCPAHFHLNCLDPPLCNVPDVRWMCPLHPHHILDKVMKNSSSITELMTWWSKLSTPVDDDDVKSKFMDKIKSVKEKLACDSVIHTSVPIPDIVKYHYKHPSPQIHSLSDLLDTESGCLFEEGSILIPQKPVKKINNIYDEFKDVCTIKLVDFQVEQQRLQRANENKKLADINRREDDNSDHSRSNFSKQNRSSIIEISNDDNTTVGSGKVHSMNTGRRSEYENLSVWDDENKRFRFASCGIYDYTSIKGVKTVKKGRKETPWQSINNIILRDIDKFFVSDGVLATKLDGSLKQLLAKEKVSMLIRDWYPSFLPKSHPYPFFPPPPNKRYGAALPEEPKRKVRAVLCPLSHRAPLVFMYGNTLTIGADFASDICLLNYGICNFISEEHAVIFYDKLTNTYELLNYSEFNTMVDGVCYTCDISENNFSKENGMNVLNNNTSLDEGMCAENKEVFSMSPKRRLSESNSFSSDSTTMTDNNKLKPTGSAITAAETRSIYKKLLQDIDKLVTKSQEEMATIAEEDLNEISKSIKRTNLLRKAHKDSSVEHQKSKRKSDTSSNQLKRSKEKKNSKDGNDTDTSSSFVSKNNQPTPKPNSITNKAVDKAGSESRRLSSSDLAETSSETEKVSSSFLPLKPRQPAIVLDLTDTIAVRRTKRNVQHSIITSFHRDCRNGKQVENKQSSDNAEDKDISDLTSSIENSDMQHGQRNDGEYLSSNDFTTCRKEGRCRCQLNDFKFPNGQDESWEEAAPLYHGSYIRFGCVEFVFSIVNYPPSIEDRLYSQEKQLSPSVHEAVDNTSVILPSETKTDSNNDVDLSTKLKSILNVLSTNSMSGTGTSSSRSSPRSSRSSSPTLLSEHLRVSDGGNRFEINYEDSDTSKVRSEAVVDEEHCK